MEQLLFRSGWHRTDWQLFAVYGAGEGIRTPDLLITNQLLYRTELRQQDKPFILARLLRTRTLLTLKFNFSTNIPMTTLL
jgi:hypothetical protein